MTEKLAASVNDSALFREAVGPVDQVSHDRVEHRHGRPLPLPRSSQADEQQVLSDMLSDAFEPADLETGEELYYCRPGLQYTVLRKLRRGQYRVAAVLDLHGHNVAAARQALVAFLRMAQRDNLTCVRVIHGKGKRSRHKGPVLKTKVNQWLRQRDEVLAFCSARQIEGGTGAVHVLLKRHSQTNV